MNTRIETVPHHSKISMQGCTYSIEEKNVFITIDKIRSTRTTGNLSGHLRLQLFALFEKADSEELCHCLVATTEIGELLGQQSLEHCQYALSLSEQPPGAGRFSLQLSEWNGQDYIVCDATYFEAPYEENCVVEPRKPIKDKTKSASIKKKASNLALHYTKQQESENKFQQFNRFLRSLLSRS
ncbi:hypothetical protein [Marinomonas epiphytica]